MQLLIDAGADTNIQNNVSSPVVVPVSVPVYRTLPVICAQDGNTAFMLAANKCNKDIVQALVAVGANKDLQNVVSHKFAVLCT